MVLGCVKVSAVGFGEVRDPPLYLSVGLLKVLGTRIMRRINPTANELPLMSCVCSKVLTRRQEAILSFFRTLGCYCFVSCTKTLSYV